MIDTGIFACTASFRLPTTFWGWPTVTRSVLLCGRNSGRHSTIASIDRRVTLPQKRIDTIFEILSATIDPNVNCGNFSLLIDQERGGQRGPAAPHAQIGREH